MAEDLGPALPMATRPDAPRLLQQCRRLYCGASGGGSPSGGLRVATDSIAPRSFGAVWSGSGPREPQVGGRRRRRLRGTPPGLLPTAGGERREAQPPPPGNLAGGRERERGAAAAGAMKTSAELASVSGLPLPRRGRGGCRRRAAPSYVDESLFGGSQAGRRAPAARAAFDPPWAAREARPLLPNAEAAQRGASCSASPAPPAGTPRKPSKYRLKSHTPSYCDETLFGPKPGGQEGPAPWTEEAAAKLRPLLWTPPPAPPDRPELSSHPREALVRAPRQEMPSSPGTASVGAQHGEERSFGRRPEGESGSARQAVLLGRPPSQRLTRICGGSDRPQTAAHKLGASRQPGCSLPAASAKPLSKPGSKGVPAPPSASRSSKATSLGKPRPPWK